MNETVRILERVKRGDEEAESRLYELVHADLKVRAERLMRRQPAGHTLQATALVDEAWLKLTNLRDASFEDRAHFLRAATRAMQSVLVDHARAKATEKRGGDHRREDLGEAADGAPDAALQMLALDEALGRLAAADGALHEVAQLRLFGGFSHGEIARLRGVSTRTIERLWSAAQAWLQRELA
jgi:RNA polymerase sigma factor (TIGR02999 family)